MLTNLTVKDFNNLFRTNGKLQSRALAMLATKFPPLLSHSFGNSCLHNTSHEELKEKYLSRTFAEHPQK